MSAPRPSAECEAALLRRLQAGEPDATTDFIEAFLEPLVAALCSRFSGLPDPTQVDDRVIDALLRFPQQIDRYDPARGNLWNYLYRDANGDLLNAWQSEKTARLRLVSLDDVAESLPARNELVEDTVIRNQLLTYLPDGVDAATVFDEVERLLANPRDRRFVYLMLAGERQTEPYARILEAEDLPIDEQRKRVNSEKDRWRKRLQRLGAKWNDI